GVCVRCFFFSSRRRHTRLVSDWSSDVCSSDLVEAGNTIRLIAPPGRARTLTLSAGIWGAVWSPDGRFLAVATRHWPSATTLATRSEERRGGEGGGARGGAGAVSKRQAREEETR